MGSGYHVYLHTYTHPYPRRPFKVEDTPYTFVYYSHSRPETYAYMHNP